MRQARAWGKNDGIDLRKIGCINLVVTLNEQFNFKCL